MFMSAFVRTRAHSDFWNRVSPNAKSNKKYQIRFDKIEHCNSEAIRYIINIQFRGNHEMFHEDQRSSISWSASTPDLGNPPDISKYLENFSPAALISDWTIAGGKGWISAEEFISFRLRFVNIISFQIILMIRSHSLDFAIRQFHVLDQYKILVRYFALEWKLGLLLNKQSSSTAGNTVSRECSSIIIVLPYILFFSATVGCSEMINPLPKVGENCF